jgi:hypothetical protein
MMNKLLFAFVAFSIVPNSMTAQEARKTIKGKVSSFANNLQGVYVINQQTEKNAQTEENGYFTIPVTEGDTLIFSSIRFKARKIAIKSADFDKGLLVVRLVPMMEQLQEVQVFQYKNINAVALGIIPKGQKTYTPAERKFKTGTDYDAQFGLNTSVTLDPLFNVLSGRSAELRKNIEVERKEMLLAKIDNLYETEHFTKNLGLPEEHVKGFQFYIVENPSFVQALKAKNKTMASFLMGELAVKYKLILAQEKK